MAAAALSLAACAAVAAACGSNGDATPDGDGGGAGEGAVLPGGDSAAPDDDHHDPLNGVDAGCPIKFAGPRSGAVAASVPRAGATGVAWGSPENARAVDGQLARSTLGPGETTELLRITDFGFALPDSVKIKGAEVEFKRQASDTGIGDGNIELWLDGTPSDRPKYLASAWPRTIVGTHHYGQAVDTWGNDLTPALVAKPGFGVEIFAVRMPDAGDVPLEARIDSMRITLFYCD